MHKTHLSPAFLHFSTLSPDDIIDLAEKMLDGEEASLRCAMHLAYYAIYHYCMAYFGISRNQERTHHAVREKLNRLSGTQHPAWVWSARHNVNQLWAYRVKADYFLDKAVVESDAVQAVETAIIIRTKKIA